VPPGGNLIGRLAMAAGQLCMEKSGAVEAREILGKLVWEKS